MIKKLPQYFMLPIKITANKKFYLLSYNLHDEKCIKKSYKLYI